MDSLLSFLTNINVVFYLVGYVVGGMPFGYWLVRAVYKVDVTAHGSGGIGATNVVRVLKNINPSKAKRMGALVLVLDLVKESFVCCWLSWRG